MPEYGQMLQYAELAAMVAWLIDLFKNADGLVQQRTLVFDQAALRLLAAGASTGWRFGGGSEGCHLRHLKWVGNPPSADAPGEIKALSP
ncbi:hypothetical protein K7B10_38475 [Streptomyces flavotricini]|uniref:Uncharacterized protein n=1 Tax=Streptomyces flavotricini TaxID=66888 RepID=A0ABS8EHD1_9ACTN|nr:hypothetical protein [Streptomyces flavotricini]MCC0100556.1 hypothetical protein [Streptomyces flavotricini]